MAVAVSKIVLTIGKNKEPIELTLEQLRELREALNQLLGPEREVHHYHEHYRPWWTWSYRTNNGPFSSNVTAYSSNDRISAHYSPAQFGAAGQNLMQNVTFDTDWKEPEVPEDGVVHLTLNE